MNQLELARFTERIVKGMERLRIKEGDIIVVRDYETMGVLSGNSFPGAPPCVIVFAPQGVEKMELGFLKSLVHSIEKQHAEIAARDNQTFKEPHAPTTTN